MIEGLIGIFGVVIGVLIGHVLQRTGKIKIIIEDFKLTKHIRDEIGNHIETDSVADSELSSIGYSLKAKFVNTKEMPEGISDIIIHFCDKNKKELVNRLFTADKDKKVSGGILRSVDLETLELPPKQVLKLNCSNGSSDNMDKYLSTEYLFVTARNYKGKAIKSNLFKFIK